MSRAVDSIATFAVDAKWLRKFPWPVPAILHHIQALDPVMMGPFLLQLPQHEQAAIQPVSGSGPAHSDRLFSDEIFT